jgi:hypothetical protein
MTIIQFVLNLAVALGVAFIMLWYRKRRRKCNENTYWSELK